MHEAKTELRIEFTAMINRKVVSLEACVEAQINEVRQDIASLLEDLKATMVAVRESQEKMWRLLRV